MYASPFTSQQQQQHPTMNGNSTKSSGDKMSYKERFQSNFNKFASPSEPPKLQKSSTSDTGATTNTDTSYICANNNNNNESNGNSHLFYLFDKAQGITPESTTLATLDGGKTTSNGHHKGDSSSCSKYLTDPQSALRNQSQPASPREGIQRGSTSTASEEGGSISERAVPATPDFLKGNPLSSLSINNETPNLPRQPMRTPYKTVSHFRTIRDYLINFMTHHHHHYHN